MSTSPFPGLSPDVVAAIGRASMPDFPRWRQMVTATGGCSQPVRLKGERITLDAKTGEILDLYRTSDEPTGFLLTACGNRRESRCPSCSATYRDDTYHLIIAGLRGGKGVPEDVSGHPRVFATFTAPSFGAVHRHAAKAGKTMPCRPRRDNPLCQHGRPESCGRSHHHDDPHVGQPLCADCYDYPAAVLWNAHAGELWRRFTQSLPVVFARSLGMTRKALRAHVRVSFAKVAEYQARGLVHFHAVIRLDGPGGPNDPAPAWVSNPLLDEAIHQAAARVTVPAPGPRGGEPISLRWGAQLDVQPVYVATGLDGMTDQRVAAYIAKYATKGAESAGTVDRPIRNPWEIGRLDLTEHARRMIWTCFALSELAEYSDIPLRRWAHMLGYRGHFSTKSRHYSTTLGALRQTRADYRAVQARHDHDLPELTDRDVITIKEWAYAGNGLLNGEQFWAEDARERIATARRISREQERRQAS